MEFDDFILHFVITAACKNPFVNDPIDYIFFMVIYNNDEERREYKFIGNGENDLNDLKRLYPMGKKFTSLCGNNKWKMKNIKELDHQHKGVILDDDD